MNINLHIERLVLDGIKLAPSQRHLLQASIEAELTRLLSEGGLDSQFSKDLSVARLKAPQMNINPAMSSAQIGQQIAASVYQNIGLQKIGLQKIGLQNSGHAGSDAGRKGS